MLLKFFLQKSLPQRPARKNLPELARIGDDIFSEGLGLKDAAIIAFFLSVGLLVLFALVAGDGLLGEVQFLLASYVGMFVINWLLIAWIF